MTQSPIRFRPHHFLCAIGFQGKGYSDAFTANMTRIVVDRLRAPSGASELIEVTGATDDICTPCPHRRGQLCESQAKISALDARHAAALRLIPGEQLTWGDAQERIRAHVPPGALSQICCDCQWLAYGMCETALAALHAAPSDPPEDPEDG
ncbi:MAG: DUF1284 domain-containing protein [Marinibacterium sp.]|nr:DUF1284 domain-containing protein [Marinibacterium sp.]